MVSPVKIRLEPMSATEFAESLEAGIARRADEQVGREIWKSTDAEETARRDFAELLPRGRSTQHFRFCRIIDSRTRSAVGETWYSVEPKGGKPQFWVHWIWIDPARRRKGYATAVFRHLEKEAIGSGADRIGLHVVADNAHALALYKSRGFETTDLRMSKVLGAKRRRRGSREGFTQK